MENHLFEAVDITKKFGPTVALNSVSFSLEKGQVHGLIGENGSGKSTMSALMSGIYKPTSGYMLYQAQPWEPKSMLEALGQKGGIGICVQEKGTVDDISIAENIFLGEYQGFSGYNFFNWKQEAETVFSPDFHFDLTDFNNKTDTFFLKAEKLREKGEYPSLKSQGSILQAKKAEKKELKDLARLAKSQPQDKKSINEKKEETVKAYQALKAQEKENIRNSSKAIKENKPALVKVINEYVRYYKVYSRSALKQNNALFKKRAAEAKTELKKAQRETDLKYEGLFNSLKEQKADGEKKVQAETKNNSGLYKKANWLLNEDYKEDQAQLQSEKNAAFNCLYQSYEEKTARISQDKKSLKAFLYQSYFKIAKGTLSQNRFTSRLKKAILNVLFYPFVNHAKMNLKAYLALERIGLGRIDPSLTARRFSMQDRKLVELAKVLNKDPDIVILDETSNNLTEDGRQLLYRTIAALKKQGKAVLFISHDIDELLSQCDYLTILRDGKKVGEFAKDKFDEDEIKKLMVGREINKDYYRKDYGTPLSSQVVLAMKDATFGKDIKNISFNLHKGEILGIGGIADCGMHTLGKGLFGALHLDEGTVVCGPNLDIKVSNERIAMRNKIGYVSKDRDNEALALADSIHSNIALASLRNLVRENGLVLKKKEKAIVNKQVEGLSIKCSSPSQSVDDLSGGNKQKVSLAKWLGNQSEILILDCPTRGVDIGVKQFIYQLLFQMKQEGKSIVLISEELPELIGMSDRLLIVKDGKINKEFARSETLSQREILEYMI